MTEAAQVPADTSTLRANLALFAHRLSWSAPGIFILGVPTVLVCRALYAVYNPERFFRSPVTVSETISLWPADAVFQTTMFATTLCIFAFWSLTYVMNRNRFREQALPGRILWPAQTLIAGACMAGLFAGVFLYFLRIYKLHDGDVNHELHIQLSILFYSAQVSAFLLDSLGSARQRSVCTGLDGPVERHSFRNRWIIAAITVVLSLCFLEMYLDRGGIWNLEIGQAVYVSTEYIILALCFAYSVASFPELRRHFLMRYRVLSGEGNAALGEARADARGLPAS